MVRFCSEDCRLAGVVFVCRICGLNDMLVDMRCNRCGPTLEPAPSEIDLLKRLESEAPPLKQLKDTIEAVKKEMQDEEHWEKLQTLMLPLKAEEMKTLLRQYRQQLSHTEDKSDAEGQDESDAEGQDELFKTEVTAKIRQWKRDRESEENLAAQGHRIYVAEQETRRLARLNEPDAEQHVLIHLEKMRRVFSPAEQAQQLLHLYNDDSEALDLANAAF